MREWGERCLARIFAVLLLFLFNLLFVDDRCDGVYACTVDSNFQVEFPPELSLKFLDQDEFAAGCLVCNV